MPPAGTNQPHSSEAQQLACLPFSTLNCFSSSCCFAEDVVVHSNAHSIVWNREFGAEVFKEDGRKQVMQVLNTVLERVGATEMVIGHTPQVSLYILAAPDILHHAA